MDAEIVQMMKTELQRSDLQIHLVVRMALQDVNAGDYKTALMRLRVDADKLRCHETPLNAVLSSTNLL